MAIAYVGGQVAGRTNASSALSVNFALTGGLAAVPAAGDLVIVTCVTGSAAGNPAMDVTTPTGYTALGQLNQSAATNDTSMNVSYKVMGGTPDTAVTIPGTTNNAWGEAYAIQVFRGVDATTPMDVAAVAGGATGTGRPNPGSINTVTAGVAVVICGGGAAGTGANYVAPANYATNFITANGADTTDAMVGCGYRLNPANPEDPAVYTGGTTNAADSWCSYTLALRPVGGALLEATISGAGTVLAAITTGIEMLGSLAGSAVLAGALTTAITPAAAVSGTATTVASLTTEITPAASITGTATVAGDLTVASPQALFEGALSGTATTAGALDTAITPAAAVTGTGTVSGALTTEIRLAAATNGTATTSADLTAAAAAALLEATVNGAAVTSAALTTEIRAQAQVNGTGTVAGALTTEIRLAGALTGSATTLAELEGAAQHVLAVEWLVVPAEHRVAHVPGRLGVATVLPEDRGSEEA